MRRRCVRLITVPSESSALPGAACVTRSCSADSQAISVITVTRTPNVPSGTSFCIRTRTCLTFIKTGGCRVVVTSEVDWSKVRLQRQKLADDRRSIASCAAWSRRARSRGSAPTTRTSPRPRARSSKRTLPSTGPSLSLCCADVAVPVSRTAMTTMRRTSRLRGRRPAACSTRSPRPFRRSRPSLPPSSSSSSPTSSPCCCSAERDMSPSPRCCPIRPPAWPIWRPEWPACARPPLRCVLEPCTLV